MGYPVTCPTPVSQVPPLQAAADAAVGCDGLHSTEDVNQQKPMKWYDATNYSQKNLEDLNLQRSPDASGMTTFVKRDALGASIVMI